jgi:hypothetical protein
MAIEKDFKNPEIWEIVKSIQEDRENWGRLYGEAKATMQVNFGTNGRYKLLCNDDDNLNLMLIKVFEYFMEKEAELIKLKETMVIPLTDSGLLALRPHIDNDGL